MIDANLGNHVAGLAGSHLLGPDSDFLRFPLNRYPYLLSILQFDKTVPHRTLFVSPVHQPIRQSCAEKVRPAQKHP